MRNEAGAPPEPAPTGTETLTPAERLRQAWQWVRARLSAIEPVVTNANGTPSSATHAALVETHASLAAVIDQLTVEWPNKVSPTTEQAAIRPVGVEWQAGQELTYDHLVFARCMNHLPYVTSEGDAWVLTADEATQGRVPRFTTHWTMNHLVEPLEEALKTTSWAERRVVVLVPGAAMVETNGQPANLLEIDTFWDHSLQLPQGTVIVSNESATPDQLVAFERAGITLVHPDAGQSPRDRATLAIRELGYAVFPGGNWESRDIDVVSARQDLARRDGVSSGIHSGSPFERLEKSLMYVGSETVEQLQRDSETRINHLWVDQLIDAVRQPTAYGGNERRIRALVLPRLQRYLTELIPSLTIRTTKEARVVSADFRRELHEFFDWATTDPDGQALLDSVIVPPPPQTVEELRTRSKTIMDCLAGQDSDELRATILNALYEYRSGLPESWQAYLEAALARMREELSR